MPDFLIGRWNIRTRWAYAGLIWVGGPQVNPGFRGRIMCPLWNLSNREIEVEWGESVAVMDFVTTTPPEKSNRKPLWDKRTRFVFEEYISADLRSGLVTDAVDAIKRVEEKSSKTRTDLEAAIDRSRDRVDSITSVMFTALGVLIAAVAIFATKPPSPDGSPQYWWEPTVFLLSWLTTALALFAWIRWQSQGMWSRGMSVLVGFLVLGIVVLQVQHGKKQSRASQEAIQHLTDRVNSLDAAKTALEQQVTRLSESKSTASKR